MATPRWDVKPNLKPAQIQKRFGPKARLVQAGNKKWTIKDASTPGGTTPTANPKPTGELSDAQRSAIQPREWQGSEGLIGPWTREPRLNPDQYEWTVNEFGKWFARPRTELSGLNTQQRADIQRSDQIAKDTEGRLAGVWNNAAQASEKNRAATAGEITALTGLMGSAQNPTDPTGQVLSSNARASTVPVVANTISNMASMPDVMRETGANATSQFAANYGATRAENIAAYRNAMQEAAAASREQNMKYLMDMLGIQARMAETQLQSETNLAQTGMQVEGQAQRAELDSQTRLGLAGLQYKNAAADRAARMRAKAADIEKAIRIAEMNNNTSRANALTKQATALRTAAAKLTEQGKRENEKNLDKWTEQARKMWDGLPKDVTEEYTAVVPVPGKPGETRTETRTRTVKKFVQYDHGEIVRYLRGAGATPQQAARIASSVTTGAAPWAADSAAAGAQNILDRLRLGNTLGMFR